MEKKFVRQALSEGGAPKQTSRNQVRFRDSPTKAFLRCNHGKEILHLDWENQGSFFSDPCLGFLQYCRLRLHFKLVLNIRQPDEKTQAGPGPKLKIKLAVFGCPGPGVSEGNLTDLPVSKEVGEPKQPFLCQRHIFANDRVCESRWKNYFTIGLFQFGVYFVVIWLVFFFCLTIIFVVHAQASAWAGLQGDWVGPELDKVDYVIFIDSLSY